MPQAGRRGEGWLAATDGAAAELMALVIASTSVTETVYRHQLKPVISKGTETMNAIFTLSAETKSA